MAAKLNEITAEYRSFKDNQVLTAEQLNEVVHHLTDQDRLSRVCLHGVGIVCGFEVSISNMPNSNEITITQGSGITTDGDLLHLSSSIADSNNRNLKIPHLKFNHYRVFEDKYAQYSHFLDGNGDRIELFELVSAYDKSNSTNLEELTSGILKNKVVVLYLENYSKTPDVCTTIDCDNQGNLEVAKLRVLLIDANDAATVIKPNDPTFVKFNTKAGYKALPELNIAKVVASPTNDSTFQSVEKQYQAAINQGGQQLTLAINTLFQNFNGFISTNVQQGSLNSAIAEKTKIPASPYYIQYQYDLVRDLMDTYQEIKSVLFDIKSQCCPDIHAFPKHLLLGRIQETEDYPTLRHGFYKSPIIPSDYGNIEKFNFLMNRFDTQLKDFDPSFLNLKQALPIKITPSNKRRILGDKAIPAYYKTSLDLVRFWNFDKTRRFLQKHNLGYHRTHLELQEPFQFSFEDKDFYRIEGIHGQNYEHVHNILNMLRKQLGLSFDIKLIGAVEGLEDIDIEKFQCHFADLDMQYKAWQAQIACLLANVTHFFSGFSTKPNGAHNYVATEYDINREMISGDNRVPSKENYKNEVHAKAADDKKSITDLKKTNIYKEISTKEHLMVNEFDLGALLYNNIDDHSTQSAPQMLVSHEGFSPNDYDVRITYPVNLLYKSSKLAQLFPEKATRIDSSRIRDIKITSDSLCKDINKTTEYINNLFNNPKSKYIKKGFEARYVKVLDDIKELCCTAKFLETLNEEIERRKQEIFKSLSFSNFAQRHPGLEHWAGVQEGGTFVLVYGGKNTADPGKVIADFALPYMCCSDCAPINFVIAERELAASFNLEKSELCVDTDQKSIKLAFNLSPKEADISILGNPDGIQISGSNVSLNPAVFDQYDQPIQFVLNGNVVNQSLLLHKKPKFTPKGDLTFIKDGNSGIASGKLFFDNENNFDESKHTYVWSFDQNPEIKFSGASTVVNIPSQFFDLNKKGEVHLKFTLEVAGGFCEPVKSSFTTSFTVLKDPVEPTKPCIEIVEQNLKVTIAELKKQRKSDIYLKNKELKPLLALVLKEYNTVYRLGENLLKHGVTQPLSDIHKLMDKLLNAFNESTAANHKMFLSMLFTECWKLILEVLRCQNKLDPKSLNALENLKTLLNDKNSLSMIKALNALDKKRKLVFKKAVMEIVENCKSTSAFCDFSNDSIEILNLK